MSFKPVPKREHFKSSAEYHDAAIKHHSNEIKYHTMEAGKKKKRGEKERAKQHVNWVKYHAIRMRNHQSWKGQSMKWNPETRMFHRVNEGETLMGPGPSGPIPGRSKEQKGERYRNGSMAQNKSKVQVKKQTSIATMSEGMINHLHLAATHLKRAANSKLDSHAQHYHLTQHHVAMAHHYKTRGKDSHAGYHRFAAHHHAKLAMNRLKPMVEGKPLAVNHATIKHHTEKARQHLEAGNHKMAKYHLKKAKIYRTRRDRQVRYVLGQVKG